MGESFSRCVARVRKEAAARRREVYKMSNEETRSISMDWKEGFERLKEENDRLQVEAKTWLERELANIKRENESMLAQGPPKD
jgi:hypothetical protein